MRRAAPILLHTVVLTLGLLIAFHPMILSGGQLLQTDPGDTLLNHYILEHTWKWVADPVYPFALWSPPCFAPAENTLAYSENLLGTAPIYWFGRVVADELPSFQFWMLTVGALTYASTAWVTRRFGAMHWLAALAAAGYAFGLPRVNQLGHQQLLPSLYAPLAVYWVWQFLEAPSVGRLGLALTFTFLQLLASVYLGWFLVLGLSALVGLKLSSLAWSKGRVGTAHQSHQRLDHWAKSAAGLVGSAHPTNPRRSRTILQLRHFVVGERRSVIEMLLLFSFAVGALFAPYVAANRGFHRSYRSEVRLMLPRVDSYLSPPPASFWAQILPPTDGPLNHEHHLFPGIVFIVMVGATGIAAIIRRRSLPVIAFVSVAGLAVLMIISLKVGKISAWRAIHAIVPGAQAIRAVTRIFTIVYLFGWIGAAVAWSHWFRGRRVWATLLGVVFLTIGLAEQTQPSLPAFDPSGFHAEVNRLAGEMRGAKLAYVELDPNTPFWISQLAAMWAGLKADVPVVNGYSGRTPKGYPDEKSIYGSVELSAWLGNRADDCRVIAAPALAKHYPAPDIPADAGPELRALDQRPYRATLRAERTQAWPTSLTKPSPPPANAPPAP